MTGPRRPSARAQGEASAGFLFAEIVQEMETLPHAPVQQDEGNFRVLPGALLDELHFPLKRV